MNLKIIKESIMENRKEKKTEIEGNKALKSTEVKQQIKKKKI